MVYNILLTLLIKKTKVNLDIMFLCKFHSLNSNILTQIIKNKLKLRFLAYVETQAY
jgi:hypothetical protein